MPTLYLREQGAQAHKDGELLIVKKRGEVLQEVPLAKVDDVVVIGNVQLTTALTTRLLRDNTDVVFMYTDGRYKGRLLATGSKQPQIRLRQMEQLSDPVFVLSVARAMILGKLLNQRLVLQRRGGSEGEGQALDKMADRTVQKSAQGIGRLLDGVTRAPDIDTLRGYEGKAGAFYFGAFRDLVPASLGFKGRAFYPPPDPVNAALSYGYTYLRGAVEGVIQTVGLDPYLGFFHTPHHNQPSLALDLMEEFRPLVVDVIVLRAFKERLLTAEDFRTVGPKCWLDGQAARDRFIALYEERLNTPVTYHLTGQQNTYRNCILLQAQHLNRVIAGQDDCYQPLTMR